MLTSVETIAISKAIDSKETKAARKSLTPGSKHNVDVMVRIKGEITVGEDYTRASTSSLISEEFMVLVLQRCGVTRDGAARVIEGLATEYLKDWTGSAADKKAAKAARKAAVKEADPEGKISSIFEDVKAKVPRTNCSGKVEFEGEATAVKTLTVKIKDSDVEVAV